MKKKIGCVKEEKGMRNTHASYKQLKGSSNTSLSEVDMKKVDK
jgi:hypothetical protein